MNLSVFSYDEGSVPKWLQDCSEQIIDHINIDHRNSLSESLNASHEIRDKAAKMVKLEVNGYPISSEEIFFHSILERNTSWN